MLVEVEAIVETLRAVPPPRFQPGHVCELLAGAAARPETLRHYLHFAPGRYTRNLVYRDDLFELIALCWSPGSASPIHNQISKKGMTPSTASPTRSTNPPSACTSTRGRTTCASRMTSNVASLASSASSITRSVERW